MEKYINMGLRNRMQGNGVDSFDLGQDPMVGSCKNGNGPSGSINKREFPKHLSDCHVLTQTSTPIFVLFLVSTVIKCLKLM
jgi:hypothetical protein